MLVVYDIQQQRSSGHGSNDENWCSKTRSIEELIPLRLIIANELPMPPSLIYSSSLHWVTIEIIGALLTVSSASRFIVGALFVGRCTSSWPCFMELLLVCFHFRQVQWFVSFLIGISVGGRAAIGDLVTESPRAIGNHSRHTQYTSKICCQASCQTNRQANHAVRAFDSYWSLTFATGILMHVDQC